MKFIKPRFYGIVSKQQLVDTACVVTEIIPGAKPTATFYQLLETASAETRLGEYRDPTPDGAGRGVCQTDLGTFDWLKEKFKGSKIEKDLMAFLGINLQRVAHDDLDYNPLLSMIFCRLRYCAVTAPIPETVQGRALYWKQHYNSYAKNAKGTPEDYLSKVSADLPTLNLTGALSCLQSH